MSNWRKSVALKGCILLTLAMSGTSLAADPATHAAGEWQKHEYSFVYMGFTATYSCDGLADKLKLLLIAAGARDDVKSQPGACAAGFGRPDKFARADLTFYTLVPNRDGTPATDTKTDGVWRPVLLTDRSPVGLNTGDCELTELFRNNVLPMFTTRNLDNHTVCIPHQNSGSVINLRFESFATVPSKASTETGGK